MAQNKLSLLPLSEMKPGEPADVFALLAERIPGCTRDGKAFLQFRFRDRRRMATLMLWSDDRRYEEARANWQPGQFFKIRGVFLEHERYGPQLEAHRIRPVLDADTEDGFDPRKLVESSSVEPDALRSDLLQLAETHIANLPLRGLVLTLLEQHREALQRLPLTRDRVYSYSGGLLEHLVSVTRLAVHLASHYSAQPADQEPTLDRDLVVAGAILHDLGKVREMEQGYPLPEWTPEGRLTGAQVLGRDLLLAGVRSCQGLDPDHVLRLEHILLNPLYPLDGQGPRWAMFPEGLLVQYADDLDLKMAQYRSCLDRDMGTGPFTERDPLLGRILYKGSSRGSSQASPADSD